MLKAGVRGHGEVLEKVVQASNFGLGLKLRQMRSMCFYPST